MTVYAVNLTRAALKALSDIRAEDRVRIVTAIRALAEQPRPEGSSKLKGREGWRIRIGGYRVLYVIDDAAKTVTIIDVGHRREIYR